jgi:hypothetical protein
MSQRITAKHVLGLLGVVSFLALSWLCYLTNRAWAHSEVLAREAAHHTEVIRRLDRIERKLDARKPVKD